MLREISHLPDVAGQYFVVPGKIFKRADLAGDRFALACQIFDVVFRIERQSGELREPFSVDPSRICTCRSVFSEILNLLVNFDHSLAQWIKLIAIPRGIFFSHVWRRSVLRGLANGSLGLRFAANH